MHFNVIFYITNCYKYKYSLYFSFNFILFRFVLLCLMFACLLTYAAGLAFVRHQHQQSISTDIEAVVHVECHLVHFIWDSSFDKAFQCTQIHVSSHFSCEV